MTPWASPRSHRWPHPFRQPGHSSPWSLRSRSPLPRCSRPLEHQRARAPHFPPLRGSVSSLASKARSAVPPTFVAMRSQCPSPRAQTAVQPARLPTRQTSWAVRPQQVTRLALRSKKTQTSASSVMLCRRAIAAVCGLQPTSQASGQVTSSLTLRHSSSVTISMSRPRDDGNCPRSTADATASQGT